MTDDELRYLPDYPNYGISKEGRIWSIARLVNGRQYGGEWIKPPSKLDEYYRPRLTDIYGNRKKTLVHILVCRAYHGEKPGPEYIVCHGHKTKKSDCRAISIRWGTSKENSGPDRRRDGTSANGEQNSNAKLTKEDVFAILKLIDSGVTQVEIAKIYKVEKNTINRINTGKNWGSLTGRKWGNGK